MMAKSNKKRGIESYTHSGAERPNNPPVGLVTPQSDPDTPSATYDHDPHIDPQLSWAGKRERTSFVVPTVSLHVHERIDPLSIMEAVRRPQDQQATLFDDFENPRPLREAIDFYKHRNNWSNRLIAGDSLVVMNSLLEKEGMGGKVQMVYIDPPYGIGYRSNFQPFVNRLDVVDGKDDHLTSEPEQIRAFRDTWELGIHSYLSYLRDRILLAHELLHESGSVFVQIGDENVHRIGLLLDEVFGAENRIATISFATTSGSSAKTLSEVADYLLWYAKDRAQVKYRQLYEPLERREVIRHFSWHAMIEEADGTIRQLTEDERFAPDHYVPKNARIVKRVDLTSQGESTTGRSDSYVWNGKEYLCPPNRHWSVSYDGFDRLAALRRLHGTDRGRLYWKIYESEVPGLQINNLWTAQSSPRQKQYVVQTARKQIQRCMLMTTDPGDLILDPTCGSGTAAFVAEQWGRRWITCDTSRIAIAIARKRLMTAYFDFYQLAHPHEGVGSGFNYRSVDTVSARTLAYDLPPNKVYLFDQPRVDRQRIRVTGPFTVEAVPAPSVKSIDSILIDTSTKTADVQPADVSIARSGGTVRHSEWREELQKTGIRARSGNRIRFARLEPLQGTRWLHAAGDSLEDESGSTQPIVASFGPDHAPLEQKQVSLALEEAYSLVPRPTIIVFAAFQFDPEASKDIDQTVFPGTTLIRAQMSADLLTSDLKKNKAGNDTFWLIGQPDVELHNVTDDPEKFMVRVRGFDYFNPTTNEVDSGNASDIALWMLDTDYDGRSLYPRQVFFPQAPSKNGWGRLAYTLKAEIDPELIRAYSGVESLPFSPGKYGRVAVKIIDTRGIESFKILDIR